MMIGSIQRYKWPIVNEIHSRRATIYIFIMFSFQDITNQDSYSLFNMCPLAVSHAILYIYMPIGSLTNEFSSVRSNYIVFWLANWWAHQLYVHHIRTTATICTVHCILYWRRCSLFLSLLFLCVSCSLIQLLLLFDQRSLNAQFTRLLRLHGRSLVRSDTTKQSAHHVHGLMNVYIPIDCREIALLRDTWTNQLIVCTCILYGSHHHHHLMYAWEIFTKMDNHRTWCCRCVVFVVFSITLMTVRTLAICTTLISIIVYNRTHTDKLGALLNIFDAGKKTIFFLSTISICIQLPFCELPIYSTKQKNQLILFVKFHGSIQ